MGEVNSEKFRREVLPLENVQLRLKCGTLKPGVLDSVGAKFGIKFPYEK